MAEKIKTITVNDQTYEIKDANSGNAKVFSGTCATASATATKSVTCDDFQSTDLVAGAIIYVMFSKTNSAAVDSIKLKINSLAAKPIKCLMNGSVTSLPDVSYLLQNQTYEFVYDGTNWVTIVCVSGSSSATVEDHTLVLG